jgi:hypothetical protein
VLVSVGAFGQLSAFADDQKVKNADRGMQSTASTLDTLHLSSDTYREFALSLSGGDVWFNSTEIGLSSTNSTLDGEINATFSNDGTLRVGALEHRFERSDGEINLGYESGAVFRSGSISPRYRPSIRCEAGPKGERTIVSVVNLTTDTSIDESARFESQVTIQPTDVPEAPPVTADGQFISFRAELIESERLYETGVGDELAVDVSGSAYPDQWRQYFENNGWDRDGAVYKCDLDGSVLIRVSTIELSLFTGE